MGRSTLVISLVLLMVLPTVLARGDTGQQRGKLFFREDWKQTPAETPVTQAHVKCPGLILARHGPGGESIKKSHHDHIANDPWYLWSGLCQQGRWAVSLRKKDAMVDLSRDARVRWRTKQSGPHVLKLVLQLADGTWLVSDQGCGETADWTVSTLHLDRLRWQRLDINKIEVGKVVPAPDLRRVRSVGWTDATVGQGSKGCTRVDWIEVYGASAPSDGETGTSAPRPPRIHPAGSPRGTASLAALGVLDVTAAPFRADPTGTGDSTKAIQQAITRARDRQMVCFFPPGQYRISDTLVCKQFRPLRPDGKRKGTRDYPCVLVGSQRADRRPRILLAPHSTGFDDPQEPKYVVHFWAPGAGTEAPTDQPQPNISMNQMLIGIDIVIGEGNSGAVGIRHRAAQGSGVQDCTIDATHGYCGLEGGAGSGGSHANVTVIGGRIGVDLRQTQPAPTVTGLTLLNQAETALICSSRQTLCAVGLRVEKQSPGPAIVTRKQRQAHHGQLCLVDSVDWFAPLLHVARAAGSAGRRLP